MAWCPHCVQDRPIQRQTFEGKCSSCGQMKTLPHNVACRGPVAGALDVCTHCNTPVFAKAADPSTYNILATSESQIVKPACFVVTATMGDETHPVVKDMRCFRDEILSTSGLGRAFINQYHVHGPQLASQVERGYIRRLLSYLLIVGPAHSGVRVIFALRRLIAGIRSH